MTAADEAYRIIREAIATGRYPGGFHLTEEKMSSQTGLSRTPVREALRQLQREGWVQLISNRGVFVNSFTYGEIDDVFLVRLRLEPHAAELAAKRITKSQLDELDHLNGQMLAAVEQPDGPSFDIISLVNDKFHRLIVMAANSPSLRTALDAVAVPPMVFTMFRRYDEKQLRRSVTSHFEIADALRAGDSEWSRSAMASHLSSGRQACGPPKEAQPRQPACGNSSRAAQ